MSKTKDLTPAQRERLIDLAVWIGGEDAKRRIGLPSEWNQTDWMIRDRELSCGTACCAAGKIAWDDGLRPVAWEDEDDDVTAYEVMFPGGELVQVEEYAKRALGLTYSAAAELFGANNNLTSMLNTIRQLLLDPTYFDR